MIKIVIENDQMITKAKKDGGQYQVQEAWAYTHGPNGPHPHPQRIEVFPLKNNGTLVPYQKGEFALSPESYGVRFGRLDLFARLIPWGQAIEQLKQIIVASKKAA